MAQYKNATMQRVQVAQQYRALMQVQPRHVYIMPAPGTFLEFHGVIFVSQSFYAKGVFRFKVTLPDECVPRASRAGCSTVTPAVVCHARAPT